MDGSRANLGDVAVLGLGRTGEAVMDYLLSVDPARLSSLTLYGGASAEASELTRSFEARGARVVLGTEELEGAYDLAVLSPGIPATGAFWASAHAHAAECISEPEFAWRESPENWLAITGTNGKTTTTTLTRDLLLASGMEARAVGNIGDVVTGRIAERRPGEWFVAELSSFQLEACSRLRPRAAVLLNITPDHVGWHGSLDAYARAKEAVFANMGGSELSVVCPGDAWCEAILSRLVARGARTLVLDPARDHGGENAAFMRDGLLTVRIDGREHALIDADELAIKGIHNVANALAAATLALEAGADDAALRGGLTAFRPLEHRVEPCGEVAGVACINDSKATNVDSVLKALEAFPEGRIVLLAGGHDKMTDISELCELAAGRCRAVVCFGDAGERFEEGFAAAARGGHPAVVRVEHLADAFEAGLSLARPGDTLLLSPACSSFDEFSCFEERGERFKQLVAEASEGSR